MDDRACEEIANRIADLEREVEVLQSILESEPDLGEAQIRRIRRRIFEAQRTIGSLRQELILCEADIAIVGVEKTQATQYFDFNGQGSGYAPDNSVPLIAQRTLILRVYVDSKTADPDRPQLFPLRVSGRVVVDRIQTNGSAQRLATLSPINGSIAGRPAAAIDRGNADHTLNFRVNATDCQGLLRFTITVFRQDPVFEKASRDATGSGAASFTLPTFARFERVPGFRVHGVLVHYTGDGMNLPAPSGIQLADTLDYVLRTYPIAGLEFEDCLEIEFDKNLRIPGGGCGPGFEGPGGLMEILRDLDDSSDRPAIRVALIPKDANTSVAGCGNRNIAAAKVGAGATLAQEMGHALDRKHAPAGGAPGADPNYPEYDDYPSGSIGEYGFDIVTSTVYNPSTAIDFMGYGGTRWVSPYTYMGLRAAMVDRFEDPSTAFREEGDARREMLFLSFRIMRDGGVEVRPSFHLPARPRLTEVGPLSDVVCELVGGDGQVLQFHRCRLRGSHTDADGPHVDFHETIPWVEEAASIRFLRGSDVLHVHTIETDAPTVALQASELHYSAEPTALSWTGDHADRDLTYMVRYSRDDGRTWRAVAVNLTRPESLLRWASLPGGDHCVLQVVASSGIRTTVVQSTPFSVPHKPRAAHIVRSADTRVVRGGAFSPDFGLAAPEDTVWTSHIDGFVCRGLMLMTGDLSDALHRITVSAPDGLEGLTTASTTLTATAPAIPG